MGFLNDILGPITSAISDVENAISEVVKLFGEAARFLEDLIKTILDVVEQIKHLFNLSKIEYLFIHPFKEAALTAISDIKKLTAIALKAGGLGSDILGDITDGAESSIRAVVEKVKDGMSDFEDATSRLIQKIKDEVKDISYDVFEGFHDVFNDIESYPSYLEDFGRAIEKMFKVTTQRAYHTAVEFDNAVEKKMIQTTHDITSFGNRSYQPLDKFKQTIETRIKSESDTLDLLVLIFVGLIIGTIIAVYMLTKSVSTVLYVIVFLVIIMIVVLIVELL